MNSRSGIRFLQGLAHLYGVQTAYYDVARHRQQASAEALLAVLRSMGVPVAGLQDVPSAWRERRQALWKRLLEPVSVVLEKKSNSLRVCLPVNITGAIMSCHLLLESGGQHDWQCRGIDLPVIKTEDVEGTQYVVRELPLPDGLPMGYHRFTLEIAGRQAEALIISAPQKAYSPPEDRDNRIWGGFLPLYALRTPNSWGNGSFTDLAELISWVSGMGGQLAATLPLLPIYTGKTADPSPYLPVSRLLWNEFYLDIARIPELSGCPSAQALLASSAFRQELETLRNSSLVDYHRAMALKRQILEELCRCFFAESSGRLDSLQCFLASNPAVEEYARFRAIVEKKHLSWHSWPQPLREGNLKEGDYDEDNRRYHLYVQWQAHQQIESLSATAREKGVQLYLDLPLGVHPDGYDAWHERDAFVLEMSAGAPPDAVFTRGQNWFFPPPHPDKVREHGYRYPIAYLRHHLRHAGVLRIDHVMGLHRLFCIPKGMEASRGVYIRYHAGEMYAILALESQRHKAIIVGEDLGTVPAYVRPAMNRHGLHRMYVLHYELAGSNQKGLPPIPRNSVASLNTHDMPPFAALWQGLDIRERLKMGLLDKASALTEKKALQNIKKTLTAFLRGKGWLKKADTDTPAVLQDCLSFLAASQARIVLVNLEDLWLETQPQNIPCTGKEYPNWRRKARYRLDEFCQMPSAVATLCLINRLRKQGRRQR